MPDTLKPCKGFVGPLRFDPATDDVKPLLDLIATTYGGWLDYSVTYQPNPGDQPPFDKPALLKVEFPFDPATDTFDAVLAFAEQTYGNYGEIGNVPRLTIPGLGHDDTLALQRLLAGAAA